MQYIILFHDNSTKEISEKIGKILTEKMENPNNMQGVNINGSFYKFSSIAKILTLNDYYQQYPDQRPETIKEWTYPIEGNQQIRKPTTRARELMKQGFVQYHKEQGRTDEEAEQKWKDFIQAGVDYRLTKNIEYD